MTYNGKTVVSVAFGPNVSGTSDIMKNIDVLFEDNTTMTVKYSVLLNQLGNLTAQQANLTSKSVDITALKGLIETTLNITS